MVKKVAYFKGFTLAEVMIVLTVIGVLTAILLPVARQSMPDRDLMKFKKAHNTFLTAIRELVTSDKYYLNGDLGVKPDGTLIDGTHEGDYTYFCKSLADILNVKTEECTDKSNGAWWGVQVSSKDSPEYVENMRKQIDNICKLYETNLPYKEIILPGNVMFHQLAIKVPFGANFDTFYTNGEGSNARCVEGNFCENRVFSTTSFHHLYKGFCIDIDGLRKGEDPFGYGIRADGKIFAGARATEWLERDVNEE